MYNIETFYLCLLLVQMNVISIYEDAVSQKSSSQSNTRIHIDWLLNICKFRRQSVMKIKRSHGDTFFLVILL